jgi:hypothetical protein
LMVSRGPAVCSEFFPDLKGREYAHDTNAINRSMTWKDRISFNSRTLSLSSRTTKLLATLVKLTIYTPVPWLSDNPWSSVKTETFPHLHLV